MFLVVLRLGNDLLLRRVYCFSMCVRHSRYFFGNKSFMGPIYKTTDSLILSTYNSNVFYEEKRISQHMYFLFREVHKKSFFNQDFHHSFTTTTIKKKYWVYKFKKGVLNISNAEYIDLSIWRWYLIHHLIEASSHCFISHRIKLDRISNFVEKNVMNKFIP